MLELHGTQLDYTCNEPSAHAESQALLKSVHQCPGDLNSMFFSDRNVRTIQNTLQQEFHRRTGHKTEPQRAQDLVIIMRSVYILNARHLPTHIEEQVNAMNNIVVEQCLPMIARNVEMLLGYIRDASNMYTPMARSVSTTMK